MQVKILTIENVGAEKISTQAHATEPDFDM